MRIKLPSGIFGHFFLRASIIQTFFGLLMLAIVLPYFDQIATKFAAEQGRTLANSTMAATIESLNGQDYGSIVDYCLNVIKDTPNILFVVYSNKAGEELIVTSKRWSQKNKSLPYYQLHFELPSAANQFYKPYAIDNEGGGFIFSDAYSYSQPVFVSGKEWGVLTLGFSKLAYLAYIRTFYGVVIAFTLLSLLLSFYLFFVSSRRIRGQIDEFGKIAKHLSEGHLTTQASESAIGEIGVLGKAINNMSFALQQKSTRIAQLVKIVEQSKDGLVLLDGSKTIIYVNASFESISKYSNSDVVDMSLACFFKTMDLPNQLYAFDASFVGGEFGQAHDVVLKKKDQTSIDVAIRIESIADDSGGDGNHMLLVISDISERKHAEIELRIAATAFESQEGMMVTDANNLILRVNHAFTSITGYAAPEVVGKQPNFLNSGRHSQTFFATMWESINGIGVWEGEIWNRRKNNEVYPQHLTITAVKDKAGIVTNYVATLIDITLRKAAEEQIQHLAFYDSLTGLPNRRLFIDRLNQALTANSRSGLMGAILFLDLDHFKTLNDTFGHDIGDLLLQQVAERLNSSVRESDTVARLGGDEFVVLLEGLSENAFKAATQAETIAEKILNALNQPYQLAAHDYFSTPSIGVTLFANHATGEPGALLKEADIAMYEAKAASRNAVCFFDPQMQESIRARTDLEYELRKAVAQQQFKLYYQIQVDNNNKPSGAEVLVRWMHPKQGLVSPLQFIQLAEETGLILAIGQWVLDAACAQLSLWQQDALTRDLTISVNVSARQFRQADFAAQLKATVNRHAINPARLNIELTESLLLDRIEDTIVSMNELKEFGIRFSLDDFGTGYSSLQYLKNLPLYQLKIDQSFVRDITVDSNDISIVSTIVAMAKSLDLQVIAEGVETQEQRQILFQIGCMHYQGYLFSKPVQIDEFEGLLKRNIT